jgi:serine/threonine-protein kinase
MTQAICPTTGKPIERRRSNSTVLPSDRESAANGGAAPSSRPNASPPPGLNPVTHHPASAPSREAQRDLIGKTIGAKYQVRSILGEGGMGAVYEAENIWLGRSVAVKVLHPAQARKKVAVKRFHQEARAAGAIGHPNICEVYDLGTLDDGSPYLVMERLVGETLADRIGSEGGLPFEDVIDVLTQVLSGLVAAHEKGIVHRDIKPDNIFLTKRVGCPPLAKLLDFGVSKMTAPVPNAPEEDLELTRTGMVMGTPFYMSPEQARGDRNLDARVDLYACGVIMYEAITGKRPFNAANYNALLLQILTTSPRPARELRPALPHGFDEVLQKALARDREDRFQNAAAFQRELQSLRDRRPKTSVPDIDAPRALQLRAPTPKAAAAPYPAGPRAEPPIPKAKPSEARRRSAAIPDRTPSSVEIPILFSDTPLSGEHISVQASATTIDPPSPAMAEHSPPGDTDIGARRDGPDGASTKQAPDTINIPRTSTTETGTEPSFERSDAELDDNNATLIQPTPTHFVGGRWRQPRAAVSADDTVRVEGDATNDLREARERLLPEDTFPPRVPKVPRS